MSYGKLAQLYSEDKSPSDSNTEKFVNDIEKNKHVVLFYDEIGWAKNIEFEFIKNGLEKGEHCIYALSESSDLVEKQMSDFGIDVKKFKDGNLLHVYQIPNSYDYSKGLTPILDVYDMILSNTVSPLRVVSTFVTETDIAKAIELELISEKKFQSDLHNFDGIWVCPYDVNKLENTKRMSWIDQLIRTHDLTIFSPTLNKSTLSKPHPSEKYSTKPNENLQCHNCGVAYPGEYNKCPNCNEEYSN